jgi:hypothetical protein
VCPTNGTVTLVGNNRTARFNSTVSTNALGSFRFAVVDAQGYNMTNTVNLRLIAAAAPAQPPVLGIRNQNGAAADRTHWRNRSRAHRANQSQSDRPLEHLDQSHRQRRAAIAAVEWIDEPIAPLFPRVCAVK